MKCPRCHSENPDASTSCGQCAALLTSPPAALESITRPADTRTDTPRSGGRDTRAEAVLVGSVVASKYRVEGRLGQGGMGIVYRAEDLSLKRPVALKFLPPDVVDFPDLKARFLVEAQAAAGLSHPNICVIHEVGEADGQSYIAMELVAGETLRERLRRGPLDAAHAVGVAMQVAAGLAEAHRKGVIHRDIKSANIMVAPDGQAKIMDFGLAKLQGSSDLTRSRTTLGTVPYMSPEQARGEHVDHRTDIWALGVVLYEMLSGELPFRGQNDLSLIHAITHDEPTPFKALDPPVPGELQRVVARALTKDLGGRYPSVEAMLRDLTAYHDDLRMAEAGAVNLRRIARRLREPRVALPVVAALVGLVALGIWTARRQARVRWAREVALPEVERLVSQNWRDFDEAYALAERVEQYIPDDPKLAELFAKCSFRVKVTTDPPGATVWVKNYTSPEAVWTKLGLSPIEGVRLPLGTFRWKLEKDGYETVLAAASSWDVGLQGSDVFVAGQLARVLDRSGSIPPGMVRVAGAETPGGALPDFSIDAYEVTNRQFKAFVDAGGYADARYWLHPFVDAGRELARNEAMERFVDQTGRPGPATWQAGGYGEGQDDYPVSGVSWYEAAAYAAFAGKSLPTKEHWGLARGEATSLVRWPQLGGFALFAPFSNFFREPGPVAVGSLPGISPYGAYDMAGNVREWCWNETPMGRLVRGGAWDDNTYMFGALSQAPPMDRSPKNGFRLAIYPDPAAIPAAAYLPATFDPPRDYASQEPVADAVYEVYKEQFSYDKSDLKATTEKRRETREWVAERVSFEAAYGGERVIAWVFLPKNARPPFQTVVYFPGKASAWLRSSEGIENYYEFQGFLSFVVKNGRAVVFPVYKGTFERGSDALAGILLGDSSSRQYSELFVQEVKDFRRTIDYLETRPDIDATRIAFYGMSWGANLGAVIPAVENRIKVSVLTAGGFSGKPRPEADPVNYAGHVQVPTLMLNGKYDTIMVPETSQKPMFAMLGTREKRMVVDETDHIPTTVVYVRETLAWLDKYLGPVSR